MGLKKVINTLVLIIAESVFFYFYVLGGMLFGRLFATGIFLFIASPYILAVNAVMHFVPKEHKEKVLPFVYSMQ